jgi:serine phosphatase RsbU (regulator of sigma subunit)
LVDEAGHLNRRRVLLVSAGFVAALGVSALLYQRSSSANFDAHAQVVESIGRVRERTELVSKQTLAARFGLLNQYDPLVQAEAGLETAQEQLEQRLAALAAEDPDLERELQSLHAAVVARRSELERFKADNALLKNSLYYLPHLTRELSLELSTLSDDRDVQKTNLALEALASSALIYNLIGDASARDAEQQAERALSARVALHGPALGGKLEVVLAHARVVSERQPRVDESLKAVVETKVVPQLAAVEKSYQARFAQSVALSNRYRNILYAWSILLLVAFGLASNQLRRLYADLEQRVADRTAELRKALSELWGEMRLARKIQEALVPTGPTLRGCEVAALMRPTEQVGGDYYDVIQTEHAEWVLIGDVSGHGVSAGLVMMMCHMAVRTVLKEEGNLAPDELLARVNSVVTESIARLGENKYMTISALRRDPDGTIHFAGAHQDLLVYRAARDDVEVLETKGMWIGIKADIRAALRTHSLSLAPGDVLLLYTDGVTEAMRAGKLFDGAGVVDVLRRASGKSAATLLEELFSALEGFQVTDDATVLVVRQLESAAGVDHRHPSTRPAFDA